MSIEFDNQTNQPSSAAAAAVEADSSSEASTVQPSETAEIAAAPAVPTESATADGPATAGEHHADSDETQAEIAEGTEAMSALIDQYSTPQQTSEEGKPVEGRVVALSELGAVVDIGGKTEGLIPAMEFEQTGGAVTVMPGEKVEVYVLNERKEGYVVLSYLRALRRRIWENIEKSHKEGVALSGRVLDRIKGGLVVDIGIPAFLPSSQIDLRPSHNLDEWKDKEIHCRVLKMNRKRGNVVVSCRVIMEEELKAQRTALLETLAEGMVVKGKVKNMTDYGVFVDLGGLDGLLHVTDLSWGRVGKPGEFINVDDEIEVKILKFDKEKMRVSLGRKQLMPDPWEGLAGRLPAGTKIQGKVMSVTDYGAFIEIEPGVEGLVHVSEMSWAKRAKHPSKILQPGDTVEVVVLEVKTDQRRVSLGMKQLMSDPWDALVAKFPVGTIVTGEVRSVTDFGAFVEIEDGVDGLVHVSDFSWSEKIKNPSDVYKKGDKVECKVLKLDKENRRISLGIKQVNDIWAVWFTEHKVGALVKGKVTRKVEFGYFVELGKDIEALCHISEVEGRRRKDEDGDNKKNFKGKKGVQLEIGKEYEFKILKIDENQHKIGLSYRAAQRQSEIAEVTGYQHSKGKSTFTLGEMILSKRNSGL
ncbi:MAG: 30S ribosomal protein S1 [Acidobacteria bacterium]|nr:30S ribosomal protein S1 [Acidobacteriota bacterium]